MGEELTRRLFMQALAAGAAVVASPASLASLAGKTIPVYQYELATPWDVSTQAHPPQVHRILKSDAEMFGAPFVMFNKTGTELYVTSA